MVSLVHTMTLETTLKGKQLVFWDFDGVIKDSVSVKSMGYEQLFMPYGEDVVDKEEKK